MLAGFVHLVASQVITRLLTFGLNIATARSLTPEAYGVAAVQFHLINTTILFLAREGFRRACLRIDQSTPHAARRTLRIAALTVPAGALLSAAVTALLLRSVGGDDSAYRTALVMQGAAAFLEILSEPLYILAAARLQFGLRVAVETAAMGTKGLLTLSLVRRPDYPPAIAFSWAQLAYAGITLLGYAAYFLPQLLRRAAAASKQPALAAATGAKQPAAAAVGSDGEILRLAGTFTLQAAEKLVLAEGSKMAVAAFQGSHDQGVYGLVSGLGSIVVRTLFQPFEEAAFVAFSKEQGQGGTAPAALRRQSRLLAVLVRCITLVGLVAAAFGPAYSQLALLLLYGRRWADTEAPLALGLYSQYLVLLAANGCLEAFVHSVANARQLAASNAWLVAFTAVHAGLSIAAVRTGGAARLIAADGVNMLLRIAYCLAFTGDRFSSVPGFRLRQLLPSGATVGALAVAAAVTGASRLLLLPGSSALAAAAARSGLSVSGLLPAAMQQQLAVQPFSVLAAAHMGIGAACLAGVAAVAARHERGILVEVRQLRRKGAKSA
ncbi:RFT1-like protein [Chlorella sorokiniana]|uniref:Protein RFT1 homolog n=1 Tax=Chlorella sorokiniana TaxID=3076 RepID=A0A2P6TST3_CHLSO|nr:RFT1-like protein [Chlorella sorokiniana]|eukprot:PRW57113.1 RFT1-like protein [Chlorella sorokiniana]